MQTTSAEYQELEALQVGEVKPLGRMGHQGTVKSRFDRDQTDTEKRVS